MSLAMCTIVATLATSAAGVQLQHVAALRLQSSSGEMEENSGGFVTMQLADGNCDANGKCGWGDCGSGYYGGGSADTFCKDDLFTVAAICDPNIKDQDQKRDACQKACLDDPMCEAVAFKPGREACARYSTRDCKPRTCCYQDHRLYVKKVLGNRMSTESTTTTTTTTTTPELVVCWQWWRHPDDLKWCEKEYKDQYTGNFKWQDVKNPSRYADMGLLYAAVRKPVSEGGPSWFSYELPPRCWFSYEC